jgi:hypothetical protein
LDRKIGMISIDDFKQLELKMKKLMKLWKKNFSSLTKVRE